MASHPEVSLSAHFILVLNSTKFFSTSLLNYPLEVDFISKARALLFNCLPTSSLMLRQDIKQRFLPKKNYSEDALLKLEIIFSDYKVALIKLPLGYRFRDFFSQGGLSGKLFKMEINNIKNLYYLLQKTYIGYLQFILLLVWSLIKFLRRIILYLFRKYIKTSKF
jgi:hypothetical protein